MDRLTRRELKSDKFALEVGHGVEYFNEHQREVQRYGTIALVLVVLVAGYMYYSRWQHGKQELALTAANVISQAYVGAEGPPGAPTYPTVEAKDAAELKAFTDLAQRYPGSDVGTIAVYHLGTMAADKGVVAQAENYLKQAAEGSKPYNSLAKLSLARVYAATNRLPQAKKLLEDLRDHPTVLVSKDQAIFALAESEAANGNKAEARKLLEPLRTERSTISRAALSVLGDLDAK